MKSVLVVSLTVAVAALAGASGAAAQDVISGFNDGYGEYPIPPRPVPRVAPGPTEIVVTTTRRIVTEPSYDGYGPPQTVVTTRRVVRTGPAPVDVVPTGGFGPPLPPVPPRRIVKDVVFTPPPVEAVVVPRRFAPAQPVVIEERRGETTRRIIGPSPAWVE